MGTVLDRRGSSCKEPRGGGPSFDCARVERAGRTSSRINIHSRANGVRIQSANVEGPLRSTQGEGLGRGWGWLPDEHRGYYGPKDHYGATSDEVCEELPQEAQQSPEEEGSHDRVQHPGIEAD